MRHIVTDRVAWSVGWSVCLSVTVMSAAKTAERIEMPSGLWARLSSENYVLDGSPHPRGNGRKVATHCKI